MEKLDVKTTDCSCEKLLRIAGKLGFKIVEGKKHCKIKSADGQFITTIPRSNCLSKHTVKGILERYNLFRGNIIIS